MQIVRLKDLEGTEREVVSPAGWTSYRFLLQSDGMGFSMHDTVIRAGTETFMWYANHLEAVYCIEGEGEVETVDDGKVHPIAAGTLYALDRHDKHILRAKSQMRMVCVFNPPLTGREVHDEHGVYPLVKSDEDRATPAS